MVGTYSNCYNLTSPICGNKVKYMNYTYAYCNNLTEAACGNNVIDMNHTYYSCYNLVNAVCGNNVINMDYAYANTWWLNGATTTRPAEVIYMNGAYSNIKHLYNIVNEALEEENEEERVISYKLLKNGINVLASYDTNSEESIQNFHMFFGGILGNNRLNVRFIDGSTSLNNFLNANLVTPTSKLTWTLNGTTYENATYNIYVYPTLTV